MVRSGIVLINKNVNIKSFDIIRELRNLLSIKKIGHTGTIDKDQSGLMVCLLNDSTKYVDVLQSYKKEYIIEIVFGIDTDTEDIYGNVVNKKDVFYINKEELKNICNEFIKDYVQIPPLFSAKKIRGKRLLSFAHNNQEIERKPSKVYIYNIEVLDDDQLNNEIDNHKIKYFKSTDISNIEKKYSIRLKKFYLKVQCSKGTYMRTLCKNIGNKLGCFACMGSLVRIFNGGFDLSEAFSLEEISKKVDNNDYSFIKPCYYTDKNQVLTFGKFETIHLGHQKILKRLNDLAFKNNLESTVIIIDDDEKKLFSFSQRYNYIKNCKIDNIKVLPLYDDVKKWSGEYFIKEILINQLKAKFIVVGEDCSFGYKGQDKIDTLAKICNENNIILEVVNKIKVKDLESKIHNNKFLFEHLNCDISSTLINQSYNEGDDDAIMIMTNRIFKSKRGII